MATIEYIGTNQPDGMSFGKSITEKISFYGVTPVDQAGNTEDLKDVLIALGLIATGGATPLNLDGGTLTGVLSATSATVTDLGVTNDITITNAGNVILATSTGTMIGTASSQKLGFLGATPVVQQANTADLKDVLVAFGLVANGGATPLNLDTGALTCGAISGTTGGFTGNVTITNANVILATSTGTKIGTASTQKLGFFNATPIVKPSGVSQAAVATTNPVNTSTNWGFAASSQALALITLSNAMRTALVNLGLMAGA